MTDRQAARQEDKQYRRAYIITGTQTDIQANRQTDRPGIHTDRQADKADKRQTGHRPDQSRPDRETGMQACRQDTHPARQAITDGRWPDRQEYRKI